MPNFRFRNHFRLTFGKIAFATLLAGLAVGGLLAYGLYRLVEREFPDVAILATKYPQVIYQGPKEPVKVKILNSPPPGWVKIGEIAKPAMGAIVVSEDWAFFSHDGFDANQLKEAIKEDIADRRFSRGASTITMQVVKNVFLSQEKTLYRKAKEFVLAIRLDRHVSKRKVLEVYFNIAEWGEGMYGIGSAARKYFGKSPAELSPKEGAFLAMLLPSPKRYSQSFRDGRLTPYAAKTIRSILEKMAQAHYITEEERDAEIGKRLSFEKGAEVPSETLQRDGFTSEEEGGAEPEAPRELDLSESGGSE
ncbi:MAG: transglycosylase domain-containing protein [Bdellovibrionales bacterium]|nr:transglycosylase domain-containing protein [Bdellovibrionales bacterium]